MTNFTTEVKQVEKRDYNAEIRSAIKAEKELDVTNFEVEMRTVGMVAGDKNVGDIAKKTFANYILKKAHEVSDLYQYVRKENVGSSSHLIPVQADKITKFDPVAELANYQEKNFDLNPITLGAHKFGNITVISEEALADSGYDLMAELSEQYSEGIATTIDELLVKGNGQVQGLEAFTDGAGAAQNGSTVVQTEIGDIVVDNIMVPIFKVYNSLPQKYRKNATWVIGTEIAGILSMATDGFGRPLLTTDFSQTPFGGKAIPTLLGRPVVISDHVKNLNGAANDALVFFGDLSKALVMGVRQNFTIKSSTEYAWLKDGVAVKGMMRLDAKCALGEAISVLVRQN